MNEFNKTKSISKENLIHQLDYVRTDLAGVDDAGADEAGYYYYDDDDDD